MPIRSVEERQTMPVIGKIRLGIRKEAKSGAKYPSTVEHFVLTDAPDVAKVYGEDPKELDVMFPADDTNLITPTWLKWYAGGVRNKEGDIIGGKLQCYGDGPYGETDETGKPVLDEKGQPKQLPGTAFFTAKRDPLTRIVPTRPCMGTKCPDWLGKDGGQQCKQAMNVFVLLPRVSWFGVYQIDTTSWNSIQNFHQQINWVKKLNNGIIRMIPFKLVREEKATSFFDVAAGKEKQGKQYIMRLKPNQDFAKNHGVEMQKRIELAFQASKNYLLPAPQEVLEKPMEDHYQLEDKTNLGGVSGVAVPPTGPDLTAIAEDASLKDLFDAVAKGKGVKNTPKLRLMTAKKFENEADPLQALGTYLTGQINSQKQTAAQTPAEPTPPPQTQAAQAPVANDTGLI